MSRAFLLDEHFSPEIALAASRLEPSLTVHAIQTFAGGMLKNTPDDEILSHCRQKGYVLVTADVKTIPPIVDAWLRDGREHAGVVYVSAKTVQSNDTAAIAKRLVAMSHTTAKMEWTNFSTFL